MKKKLRWCSNLVKMLLTGWIILSFTNAVCAQQNIDSVEYAVDNIGGFGQANKIAITPAATVTNFPFTVNISSFGNGFHTLFVRTHSTATSPAMGLWSETNYTYFYKKSTATSSVANVTKLEYFIDTDPGEGNAAPITVAPATQVSGVSFSPNIGALSIGFHVLFIRSLDANGVWSITNYQYFYKKSTVTPAISTISKLEYFIDTDPGEGNATPITVAPSMQVSGISFTPNISSLGIGFHVLFIRSLDASGGWSITNYIYFYKKSTVTPAVPTLAKMEYFIDTDPGEGNGQPVTFSAATNVPLLNFNANVSSVSAGFHVLFLRTLDATGGWSVTNYIYFYKAAPQTASAVNIVKIEYFVDTDPGYFSATNVPVTAAPDIANKGFSVNITGLPFGYHYLNIRSLDSRNKWSVNAIDTFYIFNPLPVRLLDFNAVADNNTVRVNWQTSFEQNLNKFEILYSSDGITFTKIGETNATNNATGSSYTFTHFTPAQGNNFYMLKSVDKNGTYHNSEVRVVNFSGRQSIVKIYPVPADKIFTIQTTLTNYNVEIFSADGKLIKTMKQLQASAVIDTKEIATGFYSVKIIAGEKSYISSLIIKH